MECEHKHVLLSRMGPVRVAICTDCGYINTFEDAYSELYRSIAFGLGVRE